MFLRVNGLSGTIARFRPLKIDSTEYICLRRLMLKLPRNFDYFGDEKRSIRWRAMRGAERPLSRAADASMCWTGTGVAVFDRRGGSHGPGSRMESGWRRSMSRRKRQRVTLKYRSRPYGGDWADAKQQFPVAWTPCRFGGDRPWFICSVYANGTYCGRQVTKLYHADRLFACRHCSRLAYASQQESAHFRGLWKAQKIRMRLGGSANMLEDFPEKPKGMHWRTSTLAPRS